MISVFHYLNTGKVRKTLSTKPGEEGFSLIELVVVVAVLAVLAAIAIPQFASITAKARASAAANSVASVAKECAVKFANGEASGIKRAIVSLDGYGSVTSTASDGTASTSACYDSGTISATTSQSTLTPTFTYQVSDVVADDGTLTTAAGSKTCATKSLPGCDANGNW